MPERDEDEAVHAFLHRLLDHDVHRCEGHVHYEHRQCWFTVPLHQRRLLPAMDAMGEHRSGIFIVAQVQHQINSSTRVEDTLFCISAAVMT